MNKLVPFLILAIAPLCWAGDIVLAKCMSNSIPPFTLVFYRWFLATMIMLPFSYAPVMKDKAAIIKSWGFLSLLSLLGASGFVTLLYTGVHYTSANNVGLLQSALPVIIGIICFILYGEKSTPKQYIGLGLCVLGACYVIFQGDPTNLQALFCKTKGFALGKGDLIIMVAVIMYGLYSALLPKSPKISPFSFLFCISAMGAITMFPFYVWEILHGATIKFTANIMFTLLYVAIFPSIVAYWCWFKGIETIGATSSSLFIGLIPVFVAMLSAPFLNDPMKLYHLVGMCFIFAGMIMFNQNKQTIN